MNTNSPLSRLEAEKKYEAAPPSIKNWDSATTTIKKDLHALLNSTAYILLEFKSKYDLVKFLAKGSKKHRSTLYDLGNAVLIEVEMGLEHGSMSTDALVALKEGTTQENRLEILALAKQFCNEKQSNPTKPMIIKAKADFFATQASCFENDGTEENVEVTEDVEPPVSEKGKSKK